MLRELFYLIKIQKNVWLNEKKIKKIQEKKLRKIVKFAYDNVYYYRKLFDDNNIKPGDIKKLSDLKKIPITTKECISKNSDYFISKSIKENEYIIKRTSGSIGKPIKIIENKQSEAYNIALRYRAYLENGYKFNYKVVEFTHRKNIKNTSLNFLNLIGILRKYRFSIYDPIGKHLRRLKEIKPDIIEGYPSIIKLVALEGEDLPKPKMIFTTSETLREEDRAIIKEKFNCDVIDFYGSIEAPRIAWECSKHEGYHIDADQVIVEFVENGKNSNKGEIVITTLYKYCMPLIRYKIGDYGIAKKRLCPCGRGLPLIKRIEGRLDDFLIRPDGKKISPRNIVFPNIRGVSDWKVIQKKKNLILVKLVKNKEFSKKTLIFMKKQIKKGFYKNVRVKFQFFKKIPKDKSGKRRSVISEIKM